MMSTPPLFEIVPFELGHILAAEVQLQQESDAEYLKAIGSVPGVAYSFFVGDFWAGSAGAIPLWTGRCQAWGMFPPSMPGHSMLWFTRATRDFVDFILDGIVRRVEMTVCSTFERGLRWAKVLGFTAEGLMKCYDPVGRDHVLFARTNDGNRDPSIGGSRGIWRGRSRWSDWSDSIRAKLC